MQSQCRHLQSNDKCVFFLHTKQMLTAVNVTFKCAVWICCFPFKPYLPYVPPRILVSAVLRILLMPPLLPLCLQRCCKVINDLLDTANLPVINCVHYKSPIHTSFDSTHIRKCGDQSIIKQLKALSFLGTTKLTKCSIFLLCVCYVHMLTMKCTRVFYFILTGL